MDLYIEVASISAFRLPFSSRRNSKYQVLIKDNSKVSNLSYLT